MFSEHNSGDGDSPASVDGIMPNSYEYGDEDEADEGGEELSGNSDEKV